MMKILLVDNYDRGLFGPVVVAENVPERFAHKIARLLNEEEDDMSPNCYLVREEEE